jgi:hypothetical protein
LEEGIMAQTVATPAGGREHSPGEFGKPSGWFSALLWLQGLYYLATGVWPLVSIETFQMVTGVKTDNQPTGREADHWLVMTVGALVTAVALTLLLAACRRRNPPEVALLAVASAAGLTAIDVIYVMREVILPIYLVDAGAEVVLILAWFVVLVGTRWSTRGA